MLNPLGVEEASAAYERLLIARGTPLASLTVSQAWGAFVAFSNVVFDVPAIPEADGLLYQYGLYSFSGPPRFTLDLVRQFEVLEDGEYDHYVQFHCELQFEPVDDLISLGNYDSWWFASDGSATHWLEEVRQRPEWTALQAHIPVLCQVSQEKV